MADRLVAYSDISQRAKIVAHFTTNYHFGLKDYFKVRLRLRFGIKMQNPIPTPLRFQAPLYLPTLYRLPQSLLRKVWN